MLTQMKQPKKSAISDKDQQEGTVYAKYSVGAVSLGAQKVLLRSW